MDQMNLYEYKMDYQHVIRTNIKNIGFYGDSFVWGMGLDWYDLGVHCNWPAMKFQYENYAGYLNSPALPSKLALDRFYSIYKRRFTTQVANFLNCNYVSSIETGGSINRAISDACSTNDKEPDDIKIFLLTHFSRDNWLHNEPKLKDIHTYPETDIKLYNTRVGIKNLEDPYSGYNLDKDILIIYDKLFETLREVEDLFKVPIRFIGGWALEEEMIITMYEDNINDVRNNSNIEWYYNRLIPLYPNSGTLRFVHMILTENKKDCTEKDIIEFFDKKKLCIQGFWSADQGDSKWINHDNGLDDHHPSQLLHNVIASSVTYYLKDEKNIEY